MNTARPHSAAAVRPQPTAPRREELLAAGPAVPRLPEAREALQRLHGQELRRRPDPVRPVPGRRDRPASADAAAPNASSPSELDERQLAVRAADDPRVPRLPVRPELHQEHDRPEAGDAAQLLQVPDPPRHASASTRSARSARPSRKSACPSAWTSSRFRSCSTPPATATCSRARDKAMLEVLYSSRHPRQRAGRAGDGRPGPAGRRAPRQAARAARTA